MSSRKWGGSRGSSAKPRQVILAVMIGVADYRRQPCIDPRPGRTHLIARERIDYGDRGDAAGRGIAVNTIPPVRCAIDDVRLVFGGTAPVAVKVESAVPAGNAAARTHLDATARVYDR